VRVFSPPHNTLQLTRRTQQLAGVDNLLSKLSHSNVKTQVNSWENFQEKMRLMKRENTVVLPGHSKIELPNNDNEDFMNSRSLERIHYIEDNRYGTVYTCNNGA